MKNTQIKSNMKQLLKRPKKRNDIRITTYLEAELYDEIVSLKKAGISIKKVINEAVADLLVKYDII
jgi:hypothetical protein